MENELKEPALKYNYLSPQEHLLAERKAVEKTALHKGLFTTMTGASVNYNQVLRNLIATIGSGIKGKYCQTIALHINLGSAV